jgi:acyl-CoA dehydrogenase
MVDFNLSEEQLELQRVARKFANKYIKPISQQMDRIQNPKDCIPQDVIKEAWKLGFSTMLIPRDYGGGGHSELDLAIVTEELAFADVGLAETILTTNVIARPIVEFGTKSQKDTWLRKICSAEPFLLALASTEPQSGSDTLSVEPTLGIRTTAKRHRNGYILNGTKCFITNAGLAKLYLVVTRTDPQAGALTGLSVFMVPADTKGLKIGRIEDKMGHRLSQQAEVILEDCFVPEENLIGSEGDGFKILMDFLASSGIGVGALSVGLARSAFDASNKYAHERMQGGCYIFAHQAVGFMLVDMKMKIEAARNLVWKACWYNDTVGRSNELSAMAKTFCSDVAVEVTLNAVQIFGGYGYMRDYPVEKLFRDAKLMQIYDGTNQLQRLGLMMML